MPTWKAIGYIFDPLLWTWCLRRLGVWKVSARGTFGFFGPGLEILLLIFGGKNPFCGVADILVLDFWWHLPWVSKPGWTPLFVRFIAYTEQIPQINLWCDMCWHLGGQHGPESGRVPSASPLELSMLTFLFPIPSSGSTVDVVKIQFHACSFALIMTVHPASKIIIPQP